MNKAMIALATTLAASLALAGCSEQTEGQKVADANPTPAPMASGIDKDGFDTSVRPQDDFFEYVNGGWIDANPIPADRTSYSVFTMLYDGVQDRLKGIIEASAAADGAPGSNEQKVGDFYASFMDEARANELGISPIQPLLDEIAAAESHDDIRKLMASGQVIGVTAPVAFSTTLDDKDPSRYVLYLTQSGLGMPDRDYYLKDDERMETIRGKYQEYLATMLGMVGYDNAAEAAAAIYALEESMAEPQWTRVENRDDNKTYNPYKLADLGDALAGFDFAAYVTEGEAPMVEDVIVRQPSYFEAFAGMFKDVPVDTWKAYLAFHTAHRFAPYLSDDFVAARFEFSNRTLSGQEENQPRWKRGVNLTNGALGEVIGQLYVEEYFPPEAKARMVELVENLRMAFADSINKLEWMTAETKAQAQDKLKKVNFKIGYPDKWKDYSDLTVAADDLVGNVIRSSQFTHAETMDRLGKPVDKSVWWMTPQTVNAYYWPNMNEIVFPAAILQPPFFDMNADDAVNYGGIGGVIGHEFSHGFDDAGADYDGDGYLRNWWSEVDLEQFEARGKQLADQYSGYEPLEGQNLNGELTLGENIGDLSGLTMAHRAYMIALDGEEAPVIDGLTGKQRFFMGWAQVWRAHYRDEALQRRIVTGPHSPAEFRVNGVMPNIPEFYEAFDVQEGDDMYLPPEERVVIW
ncbi:MAG: M13 family metallopeptidase [Gammaproteobacteria bacterium]|nr:M13 family metallopeptidase [Gammaproteobacteria bacterium]